MLVTLVAVAQERTVSGKVTSEEDGSSIPGVNILEKGTTNGTASDVDGNYTLTVGPQAVLVFSFIGYTPQEVPVGGQSVINVALPPDVTSLSEVVVIGYGEVKKSDLTGAVVVLNERNFNKGFQTSPEQLIQGQIAGVQVTPSSGAPGWRGSQYPYSWYNLNQGR